MMGFLPRLSLLGAGSARPLLAAQDASLWASGSAPQFLRGLSNGRERGVAVAEQEAAQQELPQREGADGSLRRTRRDGSDRTPRPKWLHIGELVVSKNEQGIILRWQGPASKRVLDFEWLRDCCRCRHCVNQDTLQRNYSISSLPPNPEPEKFARSRDGGFNITWSDGHRSSYSRALLENLMRTPHDPSHHDPIDFGPERVIWGSEVADHPPSVTFEQVMAGDDSGVAELTLKLRQYGFVIVDDTPFDEPGHTKSLLERIAFIRVTHYGGFYDFTPDMSVADTAYTNEALPAHTDTTYFSDPAGLQAFHLLSHQAGSGLVPPSGGRTLLVDGFRAAKILRSREAHLFRSLCTTRVHWHASGNDGNVIAPDHPYPVIELGSLTRDVTPIRRVRWNNADRGAPEAEVGLKTLGPWYEAAREWEDILTSRDSEYWIQLVPGKVLIIDNWRVLHGRSAFTGIRRICGGYINRDDWVARWKGLHLSHEEAVEEAVGLRPPTF